MVRVSGGAFVMGSPAAERGRSSNEGPQRRVTVSPFYLSVFPVTQAEFLEIMGTNPASFAEANLPVESVSWFDAIEYCNRRSAAEGLTPAYTIQGTTVTWNRAANGYRLPTEAEWEFACRAGTVTPFYSGDSVDSAGWHSGNSGGQPQQVGKKQPNAWGLHDMHGNVLEWCWDWLGDYPPEPETNPQGAESGSMRVYRGGSWRFAAHQTRSAFRFGNNPHLRLNFIGFRVARNAEDSETLIQKSVLPEAL
jgi:formylglycine-generating enzyme required for sulfatase activity